MSRKPRYSSLLEGESLTLGTSVGWQRPDTKFSGDGGGTLHPQMSPGCAGPSDRTLQGGQRWPHAEHRACKLHFSLLRCACHHGAFSSPLLWRAHKHKNIAQIFGKKVVTPERIYAISSASSPSTATAGSCLRRWLDCTGATGPAKQRNSAIISPTKNMPIALSCFAFHQYNPIALSLTDVSFRTADSELYELRL